MSVQLPSATADAPASAEILDEQLRLRGRITVYEPRRELALRFGDLWKHRNFALHLGWGYLRRKYRGTWLGWLWVPLRPTIDMLMRGLVFGGFLGVSPGNRPYLIFLVVGSGAWLFFDRAAYWGYRSLEFHRQYFNRIQVPWLAAIAGTAVPGAVEGALYGAIAGLTGIYYKLREGTFYLAVSRETAYTLLGLLLLLLYAWAVGVWTAPLVRKARDVRYMLRYLFGFWYFLTPVLYPPSSLPEKYQVLGEYNPLSAPISFVQHGLLGTTLPSRPSIAISITVLALALPSGMLFFARQERLAQARL